MSATKTKETTALTVRFPSDELDALRAYAHITEISINEAVIRAVRTFLADAGRQEQFEQLLDQSRSRYRLALDKLADM